MKYEEIKRFIKTGCPLAVLVLLFQRGRFTDELMFANINLYPTEVCQYYFKDSHIDEETMVCAGDTVKGENTEKQEVICKGDSGG